MSVRNYRFFSLLWGLCFSFLSYSVAADNLIFSANEDEGYRDLWAYNASTDRTVPITMTNPNSWGMVSRYDIFQYEGKIYGSYIDEEGSPQIGAYNGTDVEFYGSVSGNVDPEIKNFVVYDGDIYFTLEPSGDPRQVYKLDLDSKSITNITDGVLEDAGSDGLVVYNDGNGEKLYFEGEKNNGDSSVLYRWDSTNIEESPGFSPSNLGQMAVYNGKLYISASSSGTYNTKKLYSYDGLSSSLVSSFSDLSHGSADPRYFTLFNNKLFFVAGYYNDNIKLYSLNSSGALVVEYDHGVANGPGNLIVIDGNLYFTINSASTISGRNFDFYRFDSTGNVTNLTSSVDGFFRADAIRNIGGYQGGIAYQQDSGDGDEPHFLDITSGAVKQIRDINPSGDSLQNNSSYSFFLSMEGNLSPIVNAGNKSLLISASEGAVTLNDKLEVYEVDSTYLQSATVSFTSGFQSGDILSVTESNGISASYDSNTGVLSLLGDASSDDYQKVLRTVSFQPAAAGETRNLLFQVTDSDGGVSTSINATGKISVKVISGQLVTLEFSSQPTGLTSSTEGTYVGSFSITEANLGSIDFVSTDDGLDAEFSSLGTSFSSSKYGLQYDDSNKRVEVQISDDPYASPKYLAIKFDNAAEFVAFDAEDVDWWYFSHYEITGFYKGIQVAQESVASPNGYELSTVIVSDSGFELVDEIRIYAYPSEDEKNLYGFGAYLDNFKFIVTPNNAPVFDNGETTSMTITEDIKAISINSLLSTSDGDSGDTLTWSISTEPSHGDLAGFSATNESDGSSVSPKNLTYTPTGNYSGTDSFVISVSDGSGTDTITVSVTITAVNDQPSLTIGANQSVSGPSVAGIEQTVNSFAAMSDDGDLESEQSIADFIVTESSDPNGVVSGVDIDNSGALTYTPASGIEGTATISVQVQDDAGTENSGKDTSDASYFTITVDTQAPTGHSVVFSDSLYSDSEAGSGAFSFTGAEMGASYSYTISSSNGGTYVTGNGTLTSATQSIGNINLGGLNDGDLTLSVTLTDSSGNAATAVTATSALDTSAPSGHSVALNDTSYNGSEASSASFTFSGTETGTSYSYTLNSSGGGTAITGSGNITSADQSVNIGDMSGLNDGTLTLSVTVTDSAGNAATAVTDTATLDKTKPTVTTFSASDTQLKAGETATITIELSEASSNFVQSDISLTGGDLSNFTATSGTQYSVLFTPTANSETNATLDINADTFTDAAGNGNTAATQLVLTVDTQAPGGHSVAFGDNLYSNAEKGSASFSFTNAEVGTSYSYTISSSNGGTDVTGNGTLTSATQSISNINLDGLNDGTLTLSVILTDASGNAATAVTATSTLDTSAPSGHSVALSDTSYNSAETGSASFTFSGAETGTSYSYTLSSSGGGTAITGSGNITNADQSVNIGDMSGLNDGTLTLSVTVTDSAGNAATAVTDTATLDKTKPAVTTFSASDTQLKAGETATITIELSEASSNFAQSDISVTGGNLSGFTANSATSYTVLFTPTANSETNATLDINADTFTDAAGNGNTAATQLALTVDTQPPSGHSVVIDQTLINRANEAALSFIVSGLESAGSFIYRISDGTNSVSGSAPVAIDAVSEQVTGIDVSSLAEGTLTLSVEASDEAGNAAASISATVVKKYNVAPQLSGTPATTANEDATYSFTPTLTDPDQGDTHTYSIENKPGWAEFDTSTGVLTGTPDDAAVGSYNGIQIKVSDGTAEDTLDRFNIEVVNTNDAPVGQNFSFTLDEAATLTVTTANGLLSNAVDDDKDSGDTLTVTVVTGPQYGQLSLSEDGSFSYLHNGSENHSDSFTFQVVDASSARSETHTVSLTMNPVADAPVTVNDTATTNEDAAVTIKLLDNDYDPEGDMVASSAAVVTQPGKGSVTITNGIATYTPNTNANGQDSFTYTVKDALLNTSEEATVMVTIAAVNDLPVAANQTATINEDHATGAIAVREAASDVEDGKPTGEIAIVIKPSIGSVAIDQTAGTLVYTPNPNKVGTDTFTYTITDSENGVSEPATVTVNIGAVNDRPVAGNDSVTTDEDVATTLAILTNDTDIEDPSFSKSDIALEDQGDGAGSYAKAKVNIQDDGSLAITPRANENGTFSFTYTLTDSEGLRSAPATVTVTLTPVNDAPVAEDNTAELQEEGSFEVNVLGNDTDVDTNDSFDLSSVTVVQSPANGQVQVTPKGAIVYTANANYYGDDTFTYTVKDAAGAVSNEATVTMTVAPVNDAPVATTQSKTLDEDTTLTLTLSGTDIEDDALLYSITESTSNGKLEQLSANSWRYTPDTHFNGADSFKFKVNDGELDSEPVEVSLTVNPINDAPSVQSLSVNGEEDKTLAITLVGSDVEHSSLIYQLATRPENGSARLSGNEVTYQADANFFGQDSFTYIANDGELDSVPATVTITIAGVNDAPTISGTPEISVDEDTAYLFAPVGHDNDSADTLSFDITNKPSWASFDEASGALSGTPGNADVGITNNIVISVSDGTETASLPGFSLTVNNVNDAPVISGNPATEVNEDSAYYYKPQVTDVDSTSLTFSITNKPIWASFDEATGALSGTPDNSHVGTTSGIVISVSDGMATASLPAFNLTVKNINDAPVGESLAINLNEDASADITPELSDVDSSNLTRSVVSAPSHGALVATANGWTYTPAANFNGSDAFEYQVSDGQASSVTYTVTLNIAAVNDAPVAVDDSFALTANDQAAYILDVLSNDKDIDEDTLQLDWVKPTSGKASLQDGKILLATTQSGTVTVRYGVIDGNGGKATAKALVTIKSNKLEAPTITAPADVEVKATAMSTKVDLGTAVAFDSVGNPLPVALVDKRTFFRPGVNMVYWQTEDSQGNRAEASQTVIVHPLVSIEKDGETTEGTSHTVKVYLNGSAPSYPVTIPYTVSGTSDAADHTLTNGEVIITAGTVGEITFEVQSDEISEGAETLTIALDPSLNLGSKNQYTLVIYEQNVAPKVSVTVMQGDEQRSKVESSDQVVTVTATVADPNAGDTHTYSWVAADDKLATAIAGQTQGSTLIFSPSELGSAIYHLQLTVTDNGQEPLSVKEDVYLEVVAALAVLGDADSDGDLIPDNQEGHTDSDNDGIPDYQDAISDCNVIQETVSDPLSYLVEGDPGVCLRKGVTVAGNETGGTQLLDTEVTTLLGEDEVADNIGGIFDFVATGLPQAGQSYRVVFPQRRPIPANAIYRKYKGSIGWVYFVEDAENSLASTQGEAGYCPPPGDACWTPGLTEGHWCVQLTIEDGGPNDDDGIANGSVLDPGGVAARASSNTLPVAKGDIVTMSRNSSVIIDVLANDSDADGNTLDIANATADFGSVAIDNNQLNYTAADNFFGVATVSYSITDNSGGTAFADVTVNVVNSLSPVAVDDQASTDDQTVLVINVLDNDSDPDGDSLTVVAAEAESGQVTINTDQTLTYTPKLGFDGIDRITYRIRDPHGLEDTAVVQVEVSHKRTVVIENESGGALGGISVVLLALLGLVRGCRRKLWPVLLLLVSFSSQADWFVEADVGQSNADENSAVKVDTVLDSDDTDFYWAIGLGYAFDPNWEVTVRYIDQGQGSATIRNSTVSPQEYHQSVARVTPALVSGVGLDVSYSLWQVDALNVAVSLGGMDWETDYESRYQGNTIKSSDDGIDPYLGIEFGYNVSKNWVVALEATRYFIDINDVDTYALKFKYRFIED